MATVLVVDDRSTNREVARATLDHGGYQVAEATEGRQALELAQHLHPDVVLADVVMPGMDGYEFAHELHANPDTADIPILLYSANFLPDEAAALAAEYGVSKVVSKSADPLDLIDAVEQALHTRPTATPAPAASDLAAEHLRVVNAKLLEKVLALDESEARFEAFGHLSPVGIVFGGEDLHASYVNQRLAEILGQPAQDLLGTGWLNRLPPACRDEITNASSDSDVSCSIELTDSGGSRWLSVGVRRLDDPDHGRVGFVAIADDITELIDAERRRIAERFDSLARLSGAIAHDFNNMLGVILSFTELIDETLTETTGATLTDERAGQLRGDLNHVASAAQRAGDLAHRLLTFGGREVVQPTVVAVNAAVEKVHSMIVEPAGERITTELQLERGLPNVHADADQLCEVLFNLAVNARDAMPDGGRLLLCTSHSRRAASEPDGSMLPAGEYVHIAVADTGHGMRPEIAEHAIEPFFTTKGRGRGTGLGLATAYGIVKQAGGDLTIDTTVNRGTTIHIYLPATDEPVQADPPGTTTSASGNDTILLAEDEDGLRHVTARILRNAGYQVLTAANGAEALAVAQELSGPVGLVLTDVVMPVMTGPELADALRQTRPDTPVLYMSGYAAPLMTEQGILPPGVTVVGKPFTKQELLAALSTILTNPLAPA